MKRDRADRRTSPGSVVQKTRRGHHAHDRWGQFVVLGAGFDTRVYRLPKDVRVRCFEVNAPRTQAFKREMLTKAGVDATAPPM